MSETGSQASPPPPPAASRPSVEPCHPGDAGSQADSDDRQARRDWSALALLCGLFSAGWAIAVLLPNMTDLPAWPAASVGIFAIVFARAPGRPLIRGFAAFLGVLGLLVGLGKILALWGLLELLG
ncbi:MAG TPA: hypothetical protein VK034_16125 [Enhygromyxa sp.]|nr:hypothetical protein [Enhygromyxa sp.]